MTTTNGTRTPRRIASVVLCSECEAVFIDVSLDLQGTMLPCGHKAGRWMVAACIHDGQAAEDFISWADHKDLLDRALNHLRQRGGSFDPNQHGPGGFVRPAKDRK